jgi:hypothetical protein
MTCDAEPRPRGGFASHLTLSLVYSKQDLDKLLVLFNSGASPPADCGTGCKARLAALEHMSSARDRLAGYLSSFLHSLSVFSLRPFHLATHTSKYTNSKDYKHEMVSCPLSRSLQCPHEVTNSRTRARARTHTHTHTQARHTLVFAPFGGIAKGHGTRSWPHAHAYHL